MRKSIFGAIFSIFALVLTVGVVVAHAPTLSINSILPLEYATFPQTYNVTGTLTHAEDVSGPNDNVCATNAMKVIVNDGISDTTILDEGNPSNYFGWNCTQTVGDWNVDWEIPGPGTYTITASAKHQSAEGEDVEEVAVTQLTVGQCPAAPAIAGDYMRSLNIKSGSKAWQSTMKAVAGETGSKGSLWASNACDAGYANDVKSFVDSL